MSLGSGSLKKKDDVKNKDYKKPVNNEAAEILKKMEAKQEAGDCPFC